MAFEACRECAQIESSVGIERRAFGCCSNVDLPFDIMELANGGQVVEASPARIHLKEDWLIAKAERVCVL